MENKNAMFTVLFVESRSDREHMHASFKLLFWINFMSFLLSRNFLCSNKCIPDSHTLQAVKVQALLLDKFKSEHSAKLYHS